MWKEIRKNYRRLIASLLTMVMVITNAGGNLGTVFAAGETETALFVLEGKELREAIREAEESEEVFDFSGLRLAAGRRSIKTRYEKLLGKKEGKVYALDMEIDDSCAPEGTELQVFYHAGTGDVIFLFLNGSEFVVDYRVNIDGYETEPVRVNPNSANIEEDGEDAPSYAENYEAADMIDDEGEKLKAEVLNPTEVSGEEESIGDASEDETGEGSREEADKNNTSEETEGTTAAGDETGNESHDAEDGTPEEKEKGGDVSEAGTEAEEVEESEGEAEEGTEEETVEAGTVSDEEEADCEDKELLGISRHNAAIVTISADELNGKDAEFEKEREASEETEGENEEETEGKRETEYETERETESEARTDEGGTEVEAEADTKDDTAHKTEEKETESKPEEGVTGSEAEGKPEESEAEGKPEESEAGNEAEGKAEESEAESEAEGKPEENGAESGGDIAIEETDKEDSSVAADPDGKIESDRVEIEGQLLEDDDIEILGELKGKAYDTVTILDHVNARAWKIALEDMEAVISMECEHEFTDGVCILCEAECLHEEWDEEGICTVCGMDIDSQDKEVPEEVKAFLDAVEALEESVKAEDVEKALACVDVCGEAFDALSQEDMEREDVIEAISKMAELMDEAAKLAETGAEVDSYEALKTAVEKAEDTPATITITKSFDIAGYLEIKKGQDITLTAKEDVVLGRSSGAKGSLWVNGTLTLEDIVLDGGNIPAGYAMVYINPSGKVTMNQGAAVQNAYNDRSKSTYGGGVYNQGAFYMTGGTISGNTAKSYGGGVYNLGTFDMTGGTISGNENPTWYGGGVYNGMGGTFTMSGGEISSNKATNQSYGHGGGVYNQGTFDMKGGKISGNNAVKKGGGIYNYNAGTFNTTEGEISGNDASSYNGGGGVYSEVGINMEDTVISGNTNGGVIVDAASKNAGETYSLTNLTITGNTKSGSALSVSSQAAWKIQNCIITANKSEATGEKGSTVVVSLSGSTNETDNLLRGCTISGNTTKGSGALSISCAKGRKIQITDCIITDNESNSYSGGIFCGSCNGQITIGKGTRINGNKGNTTGGIHLQLGSNGEGCMTIDGAVVTDNSGGTTGGVYTSGKRFEFKSGAIYGNTGCDFSAGGFYQQYSLIKASDMADDEKGENFFSTMQYSWAGAPNGKENLDQVYDGRNGGITLTAMPNLKRAFAKVDGKEYETLEAALNNVKDGGTIEVIYGEDGFSSKYEISEPFDIDKSVSIKFNGQKIIAKDGGELFTIHKDVTLTLQGNAMMGGNIVVDGSNLTMDGGIQPYGYSTGTIVVKDFTINVKEGVFTINGEVAYNGYNLLKVKLAKGRYITAGEDFAIKQGIRINLDEDIRETFNNAASNVKVDDAVIIEGCRDEDIASKITLVPGIGNRLAQIKANNGSIVLSKAVIDGCVFVDGVDGDDKNTGLSLEAPVKTFEKAKEKLKECNSMTIYVVGELTLKGTLDGIPEDSRSSEKIILKRYPEYKGCLVNAISDLTVTNITLDGSAVDFSVKDGKSLIKVSSGKVTLGEGVVLQNNDVSKNSKKYPDNCGGGVYVGGSATLEMHEGAKIENCTAAYGGGVLANGEFVMDGGRISKNQAVEFVKMDDIKDGGSGGGVAVITNTGKMTMNGGRIASNTAVWNGGGIAMPLSENASELYVNGGTIDDNQGRYGGGIYVQCGNTATIGKEEKSESKVYITNNSAKGRGEYSGGGIYVNGNEVVKNGVAQLYRVVVKNNRSTQKYKGGGGLGGCGTSSTRIYLTNGGAFYDNVDAGGKGDILAADLLGDLSHRGTPNIYISPIMLGGGAYNWKYTDSEVSVPLDQLSGDREISYYSDPGDKARKAAEAEANVFITDNVGPYSGGIGSNGDVIIGTAPPSETTSISVEKRWNDEGTHPDYVDVIIKRKVEGKEPETYGALRIFAEEEWKKTYDELPAKDDEGNPYTYSIEEVLVEGYEPEYNQEEDGTWIITNTYKETNSTILKVKKVWADNDNAAGKRPASVTVRLYKNGEAVEGESITLNDGNEWSHFWGDLDEKAIWTVEEINVPGGYTSASSVSEDGTIVTITNTYTPPETPGPGPGSSSDSGSDPGPRPDPRVDIPDSPTPLAPGPEPGPEILILEEPVPLMSLPRTGDTSLNRNWYVAALLSSLGMLVLLFKKLKDDEE